MYFFRHFNISWNFDFIFIMVKFKNIGTKDQKIISGTQKKRKELLGGLKAKIKFDACWENVFISLTSSKNKIK